VAAASGQAAQFMAISAIAGAGDNIVSTSYLYGGVSNLPLLRSCEEFIYPYTDPNHPRRTTNSKVVQQIRCASCAFSELTILCSVSEEVRDWGQVCHFG
jgi:O-acetylhomoserine/O-acetylserine sulfhydrylase-like pyridoxal-dependent enzyme